MITPRTSIAGEQAAIPLQLNIVSVLVFLVIAALHLRAMNMLYEGLKEKGAVMLVPSTAVESMGMGGLLGAAAMRQQTLSGGEKDAR